MPEHNPNQINAHLRRAGAAAAGRLHWFAEIDSTNKWLLAHPDAHARACIAELQTQGRGRRGRVWHAEKSSAVLLSLGWNLDGVNAAGLSLVSGLAAVDALSFAGVGGVGLKWPNDLIARGKKLGGVLVELRGGICIIGVGVNVMMPAVETTPQARTDLQSLGFNIDRDAFAADLIIAHERRLRNFCGGGFAQFAGEWRRLHAHENRAVEITSPRETFRGIARGVDDDGALLVEQCDGESRRMRRIISGEVSLRAVERI